MVAFVFEKEHNHTGSHILVCLIFSALSKQTSKDTKQRDIEKFKIMQDRHKSLPQKKDPIQREGTLFAINGCS